MSHDLSHAYEFTLAFFRHLRSMAILGLLLGSTLCGVVPAHAGTTVRPFYSLARTRWLSEAQMVSSAWQNIPLVSAIHDLKLGLAKGGDTSGYAQAITTLERVRDASRSRRRRPFR